MAATDAPTLKKRERISSKKNIDRLFGGGHSKSMSAFPLRAVYAVQERTGNDAEAQMMVSVPKRMFKRAVKRNRVKRQVREGYRLNKKVLEPLVTEHLSTNSQLLIAFIWIDDKLHPSEEVHTKVRSLMEHIAERIIKRENLKTEQP
jgi:ribonuclease P protein component